MKRLIGAKNLECARFMIRRSNSFLSSLMALVVFAGLFHSFGQFVMADDVPPSMESIPVERRPYDVRVLVAFDLAAGDDHVSAGILREVEKSIARSAGELWASKVSKFDGLGANPARGLERLKSSEIRERFSGETADIWFASAVQSLSVGTRVSVRSWQPEVQFESIIVSADVQDPREIANTIVTLCQELVRPMGLVESVNQQSVRVRLRGGELTPPDPSFAQLSSLDLLVPMLAFRNKENQIERLQTIPWSYLSIDQIDGAAVTCTIRSGLKLALGGRKRGRVDTLVAAVRPQYSSTRIELLTQAKSPLPLVAHRIEVRTSYSNPQPTKDHPDIDPKATLLEECLTDRLGRTRVAADSDHRLVWLFAFSGEHLLARVPFVTGSVPFIRLEVPDDSVRLMVEADLQMIQGEVIDEVALRNTAMATARAAAKKNDWITVNQKLALLRRQQDSGTLNDRLNAIRVAGTQAAKGRKDRIGEIRINRICDDTALLIATHLGEEKVRLLVEEMEQLQKIDKESQSEQPAEAQKK